MSTPSPSPSVGRFTALVLGLVVFTCVVMIGGTGYLKYQLDRSTSTLAAPDNALGSDQDVFTRLRRDLGYGGFLGHAQAYALTHDASGFGEMKAEIKSADEIAAHMPDKTPAEMRHEVTAIVATFDSAMQKITAPSGEMTGEFSAENLSALYAALPILDARVASTNAETRFAAQSKMQFWAMMLTLVSWCSLIIASACAAGIYLTLRDKHSAPMRALAQSIQNMARGDMRTAIWGTERQDMIGELARAVDIARYHFSHLPDLSLLSEQGPVRMRFEGGSRSLFEAMMQAISRDSENIHTLSSNLTSIVTQQQHSISALSGQVESVLENIVQRGQNGDAMIKQAIADMFGSTENLKNAHSHAIDQLNRLIPHIQERAQGLAEITHITGKQISHTLHSLSASEEGLKINAEQVSETLAKISTTADDLGERLFGAINLLQASGKVLAETTDDIKTRFAEGISVQAGEVSLEPLTERLEQMTRQISEHISSQITQMDRGPAQAETRTEIVAPPLDSTITEALADLQNKLFVLTSVLPTQLRNGLQEGLDKITAQIATLPQHDAPASVEATMPPELQQQLTAITQKFSILEDSMATTQRAVEATQAEISKPAPKTELPPEMAQQLGLIVQRLAAFEENLAATKRVVDETQAEVRKPTSNTAIDVQKQLADQWFQMSAQIEASRSSLIDAITSEIEKMENRISVKPANSLSRTAADYSTQRQIEQQTQILSELVATLGILDTHMQQIKTDMHAAGG